jgi:NAD(P)-dependent dehydrogenase (short-subunit alcohol dehydrogenase family)
MTRFTNKNVIVTGAAAGVGQVIAQSFAREGANIAILDFQSADKTEALAGIMQRFDTRSAQSAVFA